jgi:hypothetical protein
VTAASTPTPSIPQVEAVGRFKLPSAAQDVHAYIETAGIDNLVLVVFRLPADDLPGFLESAGYGSALEEVREVSDLPGWTLGLDELLSAWPSHAEWQELLEDPTHTLMLGRASEPGFHRSVVVDMADPDLYTIYVRHNEL